MGTTYPITTSNPFAGLNKDPKPKSTADYHAATGGYEGDAVESDGMPGAKDMEGGEMEESHTASASQEDGTQQAAVNHFGPYPHSPDDGFPENWEGPPLATTPGANGAVDLGDVSPGGEEPNQPHGEEKVIRHGVA